MGIHFDIDEALGALPISASPPIYWAAWQPDVRVHGVIRGSPPCVCVPIEVARCGTTSKPRVMIGSVSAIADSAV